MKHPYLAKLRFLLLLLTSLSSAPLMAQAQTGSVSGRVLDEKKEGIPGATVIVDGTTLGSSSNIDGTYNIAAVPAGPHTLVVSYVGYNTMRQAVTVVAGQNAIADAALSVNATQLSEAVVIGYGTQRKQDVTGAVTQIDARQFVRGQLSSPEQLIQGKVAGVVITTNGGAPGAGSQIRIRGGSSLNASNDPLIVIDGIPVENGGVAGSANALNLINPNDIETFTVLKDASATAIYGSRASNGVILITTKKGYIGEGTHVNFSSQFSLARKTKTISVLSGDEFRAVVAAKDSALAADKLGPLGTNTNWQDAIYQTALTFDNNLSVTGSAGKVPYRVSYGNLNQEGLLRTDKLLRNTVSVGLTPVLFNGSLRVDLNLKGSVTNNHFAPTGAISGAAGYNPTVPIRDTAALYQPYGGYYQSLNFDGTAIALAPANPVSQLNLTDNNSVARRSIGNIQLDYKLPLVPGLRANFNLGYDVQRGEGHEYVSPLFNVGGGYVVTPDPATGKDLRGKNNAYGSKRTNWLNEFYLNYTHDFGGAGRFDLLAGHSYQNFYFYEATFLGFAANGQLTPGSAAAQAAGLAPPTTSEYALESYYTRLNYNYKDRYLLTGTMRLDRSSRFGPNYRNGYFPAVGAAWRIKGEDFLSASTAVSDLKLRLGFGITGQQDILNAYPYLARYTLSNSGASYPFGGQFENTYRAAPYVSNIKWEETRTYNAGLDFGFADNRLTGTVDVYLRKSFDLLQNTPVPAGANLSNKVDANVGNLENRGIEFLLNYNLVRSEKIDWNVNFNATYNQNKITKLLLNDDPNSPGIGDGGIAGGGQGRTIQIRAVGSARNSFFVQKQVYDDQGKPIAGKYEDLNGDGVVDSKDFYVAGQPDPKVTLGFSSNLRYQRLSLAFTMRAHLGATVYNNVQSLLGNYANTYNTADFFQNTTRDFLNTGFAVNQYSSDYYLSKANFLRMENITLGYTVGKFAQGAGTLSLSAAVQNLFVATKYSGIDPEINNGIDKEFYPRPRTFTFGLNVGF